jgi:hypothetical protein
MEEKRLEKKLERRLSFSEEVTCNKTQYNMDLYDEIFKKANSNFSDEPNSLNVDEALLIMLNVVHSFKYSIDMYNEAVDNRDPDYENLSYANKEIENIINNRIPEVEKYSFSITPLHLYTVLLKLLYKINGAVYRSWDPDYMWEMDFWEILELPNRSYELDSAISQFLLLPLYYATHHHLDEQK